MAMPEIFVCSPLVNRLVWTCMLGGVGRAGSTPALTRLGDLLPYSINGIAIDALSTMALDGADLIFNW